MNTPDASTAAPRLPSGPRLRPSRRMLAVGLVALAVAVVVAGLALPRLTSPAPTRSGLPAPAASQVFHLAITTGGGALDIPSCDTAQASDSASIPIANMLYDPLVTLDQNLKIEHWGADTVTTSADGLTYTFHIRAGSAPARSSATARRSRPPTTPSR